MTTTTTTDQKYLEELLTLQEQWFSRMFDRSRLYTKSVARKKAVKDRLAEKFGHDYALFLQEVALSAEYQDAKADLWEAVEEMQGINAFLQSLQIRIAQVRATLHNMPEQAGLQRPKI